MINIDISVAKQVLAIAEQAGEAILGYFNQGNFEQFNKSDDSPVTSADYAANDIVVSSLTQLFPDTAIMSEEKALPPLQQRQQWPQYWLIDPLDGTQEFVAGRADFAVNIALIENNQPVLSVIYAPVTKVAYVAVAGSGAFKVVNGEYTPLRGKKINPEKPYLRVAISRVQTLETITKYIKPDTQLEFISLGSCALKSCLVAEGLADIYIRVGPTGEWDTGAPQVIVSESGGTILDSQFNPLTYNQRESVMNPDFMVVSDASFDWSRVIIPRESSRG